MSKFVKKNNSESQKIEYFWMRVAKGMVIGAGFILPGVSGAVLAKIVGLYERMVEFMADIRGNLKKEIKYFLPIGIGGIVGIFLFSFVMSRLLYRFESYVLLFFAGCIVGMVPSLWREAGKEGRKVRHIFYMICSFLVIIWGTYLFSQVSSGKTEAAFLQWSLAGMVVGSSMFIPGLSSSSILLYLGLYQGLLIDLSAY